MSKKPVRGLSASMLSPVSTPADTPEVLPPPALALASERTEPAPNPQAPRPSTQTVKVPEPDFIRLKNLSARTRRRHQDIILTALREYLERQGA